MAKKKKEQKNEYSSGGFTVSRIEPSQSTHSGGVSSSASQSGTQQPTSYSSGGFTVSSVDPVRTTPSRTSSFKTAVKDGMGTSATTPTKSTTKSGSDWRSSEPDWRSWNVSEKERQLKDYEAAYYSLKPNTSSLSGIATSKWASKNAKQEYIDLGVDELANRIKEIKHYLPRAQAAQYYNRGDEILETLQKAFGDHYDSYMRTATSGGPPAIDYSDTVTDYSGYLTDADRQLEGMQGIDTDQIARTRAHDEAMANYSGVRETIASTMKAYGITDWSADDVFDYYARKSHQAGVQKNAEDLKAAADKSPVAAAALSVGSVFMTPFAGFGAVDNLAQKITHPDRPVDYYGYGNAASIYKDAIRSPISEDLYNWAKDGTGSDFVGKLASNAYGGLMSTGDSAVNMLMAAGGIPQNIGLAMMGSEAATSTMRSAHERGLSDEKALTLGVIGGMIEYATEKIGMDTFMKTAFGKGQSRSFFKNLAINMGAEGGEEGLSNIGNFISDIIVSGDQSQWNERINGYRESGESDSSAVTHAIWDQLEDLGWDVAGGAFSGGLFGASGHAAGRIAANNEASNSVYAGDNLQDTIDRTLEIDPENKSAKKANELVKAGKNVSGSLIRQMAEVIEQTGRKGDISNMESAIYDELVNRGATEAEASAEAPIIAKQWAGDQLNTQRKRVHEEYYGEYDLTGKEKKALKKSKYAEDILGDITDTSQTDSNGWVGSVKNSEFKSGQQQMRESIEARDRAIRSYVDSQDKNVLTVNDTAGLEKQFGKAGAEAFVNMHTENIDNGVYYHAYNTAYMYGSSGATLEQAKAAVNNRVSDSVVEAAFAAGQGSANLVQQQGLDRIRTQITGDKKRVPGSLTVTANTEGLTDTQKASIDALRKISYVTGINVEVFESEVDEDGNYVGENGEYNAATNTIRIDINAGRTSISSALAPVMMKTAGHELTHFIQHNSPGEYSKLKSFVSQQLVSKGYNLEDLARNKMALAERDGSHLSYGEAIDEVVADACEDMLENTDAIDRLAKENFSLFKKIRNWIRNFHNALKRAFSAEGYGHDEAKAMLDKAAELQKLWDDAFVRAVENYQNTMNGGDAVEMVNKDGVTVGVEDANGHAQMSLRTYDEGGREQLKAFLENRVKENAITQEEATEMLEQMEFMYDICEEYAKTNTLFGEWSKAQVKTDPVTGNAVFSVVKANGDYAMNLDFSLVCKKRRTLDAAFEKMISDGVMEDFDMIESSIAKINEIIRDNGFETACALCFVDSKRYRQGIVADQFVKMYNGVVRSMVKSGQHLDSFNFGGNSLIVNDGKGIDTLDDNELDFTRINEILKTAGDKTVLYKIAKHLQENPQDRKLLMRGDFMSAKAFDTIKVVNPRIMELYNSKKGAGGPKAASLDVQYLSDILRDKKFEKNKAYSVGGVRIQSFSDYIPRLVFDYIQMIADLRAKDLPAHAYTKEPMFVLQFGTTGVKVNMSLVPDVVEGGVAPGLDKDGNYVWRDGQSFGSTVYGGSKALIKKYYEMIGKEYTGQDRLTAAEGFELAKAIQSADGYHMNCGTIAVGVSHDHIVKMLRDPNIRMVIPYHKSSLNHIVAVMTNVDKFDNYTDKQNTRVWGTKKSGKKGWIKLTSGDFSYNDALLRLGDAKAAADEYLAWCDKNGYLPKFDEFREEDGYYKLLEDFTCYDRDGIAAPQQGVTLTLPTDESPFGSMKDLIKLGLDEDALLQARQDEAIPEIVEQIKAILPGFETQVREEKKAKKASRSKKASNKATQTESTGAKIQHSHRAQVDVSGRELLANTSEDAVENEVERDALKRYKSRVGDVSEIQKKLNEQRELLEGDPSTEERLKAKNRAEVYAKQLDRANAELTKLEETKIIKTMMDRERANFTKATSRTEGDPNLLNRYSNKLQRKVMDNMESMFEYEGQWWDTEKWKAQGGVEYGEAGKSVYGAVREMAPDMGDDDFKAAFDIAYDAGVKSLYEDDIEADSKENPEVAGVNRAYESMMGMDVPDEVVEAAFYAGREDAASKTEQPVETKESVVKALKRDAADLEKRVEQLTKQRDYNKAQANRTQRKVAPAIVEHLAEQYVRSTSLKAGDITADIQEIGDLMHSGQPGIYDDVRKMATAVARKIVSNAQELTNADEVAQRTALRKDLRESPLQVTQHIQDDFPDWSDWVKGNPSVTIRQNGTPVEIRYEELRETFGEYYFPSDIVNPADQLRQIGKAFEMMGPKYENPNSYYMSAATEMVANQIIGDLVNPSKTDKLVANMRERAKADKAEVIKRERAKRDRQIGALKDMHKEQKARARERKMSSAYKAKIKRIANDIRQALLHPTDSRYVPTELLSSCYEMALMLDTSGEQTDTKAKEKFNATMHRISTQYEELKNSKDSDYQLEHDTQLGDMVKTLSARLNGKAVRDLSVTELKDVVSVLEDIKNSIKFAKKQIGKMEGTTNQLVGESIIKQQKEYRATCLRTSGQQALAKAMRKTANPVRNVRRMVDYDTNATLYRLMDDINKGVRKKNRFIMEANMAFDRFAGKRLHESVTKLKTYKLGGKNVSMTEQQAMQIILSWERESADGITRHIKSGGITILDTKKLAKGNTNSVLSDSQSVDNITEDEIKKLYDSMDEWARDYMDEARNLFNVKAKNAINEATMLTKHRRIATSENYIPFETDSRSRPSVNSNEQFTATWESMGMLKSVQAGASNPLVIRGLNLVLEKHIEDAGQLYGLAAPIKNYKKAMGIHLKGNSRVAWSYMDSADHELLESVISDLQAPRKAERHKVFDKLQSAFIKATLLSNVSVTIKQAASYSTAGLYLSQRALAPYQTTVAALFAADNSKMAQELFDEIDAHTATHYIRRKGMSLQEIATVNNHEGAVTRFMDAHLPDVTNPLKWIQTMDVATTAALWLATKKQVELDGIDPKDPKYWDAVTDLYDKVIEDTQPNYDVMHRPEVQKQTDRLSRSLVMFQTQPLQNAGILWDAIGNLESAKRNGRDVKQASITLVRAVGSQIASLAVFALMSFIAYAATNRLGRYKDDEEQLTVWSIAKRVLFDMGTNGVNLLIPAYGSWVTGGAEVVINKVKKKKSYETLSVPTVDMINGWIDDVANMTAHLFNLEEHKGDILKDIHNLSMDTFGAFGIPAENVSKIFRGVIGNVTDIIGEPIDWATDDKHTFGAMKVALDNGHFDTAIKLRDSLLNDMEKSGKDEDEARKNLRNSMSSEYKDRYLKALDSGNEKEADRIHTILEECGLYDDLQDTIKSWKSSGYKDRYIEAIDSGNTSEANRIRNILNDGGQFDDLNKTLKTWATSEYRDRYLEAIGSGNTGEANRIRNILKNSGVYDDVDDTLSTWKDNHNKDTMKEEIGSVKDITTNIVDAMRSGNNTSARKICDDIVTWYDYKVDYYLERGKDFENASKEARSAIKKDVSSILKPLWESGSYDLVEQVADMIVIDGEYLYEDSDFSRWD